VCTFSWIAAARFAMLVGVPDIDRCYFCLRSLVTTTVPSMQAVSSFMATAVFLFPTQNFFVYTSSVLSRHFLPR
jgi:hypothetical protein